MKRRLRAFVLAHTWFTNRAIPRGERGELSKVREEFSELEDAIEGGSRLHSFIESCDLIDVTLRYQWRHYRTPMALAILFIYCRRFWKPLRNRFLDWIGLDRSDFIGVEK